MVKIKWIYIVAIAFMWLCIFFRPITAINEDLSRHILLGKIIVENGFVPNTNFLSFAYSDFPFINTTWLSAVIFYLTVQSGGYNLLLICSCMLILAACLLQAQFVSRRYTFASVIFCGVFYLIFLGLRSDIRPEIFSMLCLSIFTVTLFANREKSGSRIYLLIPLQALWVNFQIYFIAGPLIVLLFLIDAIYSKSSNVKQLTILFVGASIATLFNPNGISGALYPFFVFRNYGFPVTENQNILTLWSLYRNNGLLLPVILMSGLIMLMIVLRKKLRLIDTLLIGVFSFAMFFGFRNILLFIFVTYIPAVHLVNLFIKKISDHIRIFPKFFLIYMHAVFIGILIIISLRAITVHAFGFGVIDKGRGGVDYLEKNLIRGPYYNDFNIGGYLSSRIYPEKVFVDGRAEAYPAQFFKEIYLPMQKDPRIFEKLDEKYGFNAVILSHYDGFAGRNELMSYLVNEAVFRLVYVDSYTFVLVKNNPINKDLISRDYISKDRISLSSITNTRVLLSYVFLFEKIGWRENAESTYALIGKIDPYLCVLKDHPNIKLYKLPYIPREDFKKCPGI